MEEAPRKKSPRAPSVPLDEAIERGLGVYEKERCHAAPTDVIAQDLGYKSANNGSALSLIASLRYYGLLEKVQDGKLAVSKDLEAYRFTPNDKLREELQLKWLKAPQVFAELLHRYSGGLPSDATLRFDLIKRGFTPATAESVLGVFHKSVDFVKYFERKPQPNDEQATSEVPNQSPGVTQSQPDQVRASDVADSTETKPVPAGYDRIPVRLAGGRRAWLEIPSLFYSTDKERIKAQIDLLLTEDEQEKILPT